MAINNNTPLPIPPYNVQVTNRDGMLTQQWAMWFQQAYVRMGGQTPVDQSIPQVTLAHAYARTSYLDAMSAIVPFYLSGNGAISSPTTYVDSFQIVNTSIFPVIISLWNVLYQQFPSDSNKVVNGISIAANATVTIPNMTGLALGAGAYIVEQASVAGVLLCTMTGRIVT